MTTEVNDLHDRVEEVALELESVRKDVARDEQRIEFIATTTSQFETRLNASDLDSLTIWSTLSDLASTRENITSLQNEVASLLDWANTLTTQNMVKKPNWNECIGKYDVTVFVYLFPQFLL